MKEIFDNWRYFVKPKGRTLNEMRYIDRMFLPDAFLQGLPEEVRAKVLEFDVLDFAFEEYKSLFDNYKTIGINPAKFFVPYGQGHELFFDYTNDDDHAVKVPTKFDLQQRGQTIPVLPKDWYRAFMKHYGVPLRENEKKQRDLSIVNTLAVFDFDDTLFNSPEAPKGHKGNWHISGDSLPDKAGDSMWNMDIVLKAQEKCVDPAVYCVMMTGRVGNVFGDKIDGLLLSQQINFAKTYYNEFGGDTADYKIKAIHKLLSKLPNVKRLLMWEDQKEKANKYIEEFANVIPLKIIMVGEEKLDEGKCTIKFKKRLQEGSQDKSNLAIFHMNNQYVLIDAKKLVEFCAALPKDNPDFESVDLVKANVVISYVKITPSAELKKRIGANCMDASERSIVALNPAMRGSKLGEFLMRAVANKHPEGLMSDRGDVSASARAAVKRLAAVAKIKTIYDPDTGETLDKLDNMKAPTTKSTKDDCLVYGEDFLDRVYILNDVSIDTDDLIVKSTQALQQAAEATGGNWPSYTLEDMLLDAGLYLYYLNVETA